MLRCFYSSAILSIALPLVAARVALSSPTATVPQPSQVQNLSVDVPLCYMQTADGKIVDLQNLCHQASQARTSSPVSVAAPSFRLDSRSGYASDSSSLEERER